MTTYDITPIAQAVIMLAVAILTAFLIPFLRQKLDGAKLSNVQMWVNIAVEAAEQLFNSDEGRTKKDYVIDFLASKGFKLDMDSLDNMIEAAVLELKHIKE